MIPRNAPMRPPEKFEQVGACWIWKGATIKNMRGVRYGSCWNRDTQRSDLVHRVMYRKYYGELRADEDVHHVCFTPLCGNPAHLQKASTTANRIKMTRHRQAYSSGR